jgi:multidrug efflux system membrane fusion protein
VVDSEGTVAAREVELGPLVDGLRVIRGGITAQDRVVIQGVQMAIPGQKVTPQAGTIAAAPRDPQAAAPPRAAAASSATISR